MQSTTAAQLLEATGGTLLFGSAAQCERSGDGQPAVPAGDAVCAP